MVLSRVRDRAARVYDGVFQPSKEKSELRYWRTRVREEGTLHNAHYERTFTNHFDLGRDFYAGKRVLDVGCGPRGSLEWAAVAAERVGLDPLADAYRKLGSERHAMSYVSALTENVPSR